MQMRAKVKKNKYQYKIIYWKVNKFIEIQITTIIITVMGN